MARLRVFGPAADICGGHEHTVGGSTVEEVIASAVERWPDLSGLVHACRIFLGSEPAPASAPVAEGDEVLVLPPVGGG